MLQGELEKKKWKTQEKISEINLIFSFAGEDSRTKNGDVVNLMIDRGLEEESALQAGHLQCAWIPHI